MTFQGLYRFFFYPIYVKHPNYAGNGIIFDEVFHLEIDPSKNVSGYMDVPGGPT